MYVCIYAALQVTVIKQTKIAKEGGWAQIKRGKYKGDIAQVRECLCVCVCIVRIHGVYACVCVCVCVCLYIHMYVFYQAWQVQR